MQPHLNLLTEDQIAGVLDEAWQILRSPGVKVQSPEARRLLAGAGAEVDEAAEVAKLSEEVVRRAVSTVPSEFTIYDRSGQPKVHYGGSAVHFDPGSAGVNVLDPESLEHRPAVTADLIRLIRVTEMLPEYDAQSTALVCSDVPKEIGDFYRLYLVLLYSQKPVVTGSFSTATTPTMFELLALEAGGMEALAARPRAVFDVCPTPPLIWSQFGAQNLIDLARARVPAQIVAMPLAGAAAPVSLFGAVAQHAAECLSGIAIHQAAWSGSPIVWGGAPAIFDMRHGTTPMGAVETAMIDAAYAQVGKSLGLPTHTYLGASDAKLVDAQSGMESGMSTLIGALAGINMISGAGMLDFLACQSIEKLVLDAEAIGMVRRLLGGLSTGGEPRPADLLAEIGFQAGFLKHRSTRQLFRQEQHLPSAVIDRGSLRAWQDAGGEDAYARARRRASELVAGYERPPLAAETERALRERVAGLAAEAGMDRLPDLPG